MKQFLRQQTNIQILISYYTRCRGNHEISMHYTVYIAVRKTATGNPAE